MLLKLTTRWKLCGIAMLACQVLTTGCSLRQLADDAGRAAVDEAEIRLTAKVSEYAEKTPEVVKEKTREALEPQLEEWSQTIETISAKQEDGVSTLQEDGLKMFLGLIFSYLFGKTGVAGYKAWKRRRNGVEAPAGE